MKILVPTKSVPDTNQPINQEHTRTSICPEGIPHIINPFDTIALEEALRIREEHRDGDPGHAEVIAVCIGTAGYEKELRIALAMGADRAILIVADEPLDSWNIAHLLQAVVNREKPDLVLMGKQAVDGASNQTGQYLSAQLGWPQATFVSRLEFIDAHTIRVTQKTHRGTGTVSMPLPAVVTTDLRLNEPRYAALPAIKKARSLPIEKHSTEDLGITIAPRIEIVDMETSDPTRRCIQLDNVDDLISKLREAGAL
jgi:electron transfer flavoprotein beta subunit